MPENSGSQSEGYPDANGQIGVVSFDGEDGDGVNVFEERPTIYSQTLLEHTPSNNN